MAVGLLLFLLAVDTFITGWLLAHRANDVKVMRQLGDEVQRFADDLDDLDDEVKKLAD